MRMDEMERHIRMTGIKWAWFFLVLTLGTWTIVELSTAGTLPLAGMLLIGQFLVYSVVIMIEKHRVDEEQSRSTLLLAIVVVAAVLACGAIAWFLIR